MGGRFGTFPFRMFETWEGEQCKYAAAPLTSKISFDS